MHLGLVTTLFYVLCSLVNAGIFGGDTYTVEEQQSTHFEAALMAYHRNDLDKAIRILEFLQRDIKANSIKYPFVVWNLALLYHDKEQFSKAIQWAEITSKFETTSFVGGFMLASLLFFKGKTEHYNSFMAFRSIKVTRKSILPDMTIEDPEQGANLAQMFEGIIDYNIALILYKLGAVAAADAHLDEAMNKVRNMPIKLQLFKKVKLMKGIDYSIDTSPIANFRLLKLNGEADVKKTEPLQWKQREDDTDSEHILAYYFDAPPTGPFSVSSSRHMIPSPHQLSSHYDHHIDYFSHKSSKSNSKVTSPNLVVPPRLPRPTLNRGFTAPPHSLATRSQNLPSNR